MDLIFPHHENEIAQSVAAGDGSRATGVTRPLGCGENEQSGGLSVYRRAEPGAPPTALYLVQAHYRSLLSLCGRAGRGGAAYQRIERFVMRQRGARRSGSTKTPAPVTPARRAGQAGRRHRPTAVSFRSPWMGPRVPPPGAVHAVFRDGNQGAGRLRQAGARASPGRARAMSGARPRSARRAWPGPGRSGDRLRQWSGRWSN